MINIMYIVLTAMLALNVSVDVLNGFNQVHEGLKRTNDNAGSKNDIQFMYLRELYNQNPIKVGEWMNKGKLIHEEAYRLIITIDSLKTEIAKVADGKKGDYENLKNQENLFASPITMLNPVTQEGRKLKLQIENFKKSVSEIITDSAKTSILSQILSTDIDNKIKKELDNITWEGKMFDNMPAIAAITLLTKLQNDIRQAESETLSEIITNVDIGDVRVNEINPYVIPSSNMVMRGGTYSANIVMAAIDTTQRPLIYIDGKKLENEAGFVEIPASSIGTHEFNGFVEVMKGDGSIDKKPFKASYTVMEPMATISPTLMNVLYAGIENPVSISVPGVPMNSVQATMTNGSLQRNGDTWIARPDQINKDVEITVTATVEGKNIKVGQMAFRVRKLPDPSPFILISDAQGNQVHYKGSPKRISKQVLLNSNSLGASIDDGILDISYSVVSFSTVFFDSMGNAIPEVSDGANFSARQKEQFRRLKPGKSFFISNIKAKGPDGITRDISPMEVSIN